jgi:hypothetical protein
MRTEDPRAIAARRTAGSASIRARGRGAGGRGPDRACRRRPATAGQEDLRSRPGASSTSGPPCPLVFATGRSRSCPRSPRSRPSATTTRIIGSASGEHFSRSGSAAAATSRGRADRHSGCGPCAVHPGPGSARGRRCRFPTQAGKSGLSVRVCRAESSRIPESASYRYRGAAHRGSERLQDSGCVVRARIDVDAADGGARLSRRVASGLVNLR